MSLHPQQLGEIPPETIRVAHLAFPKGNIYLRMRDELGVFYEDQCFSSLFSLRGQPALAPWRLALITIMQFVEGLTDRQTSDSVRSRIDWKYALGLELTNSGFDFSVLSEFRSRLIEGGVEQELFQLMLSRFQEKGFLKSPQKQRTDSTHILAAIRILGRLENIGETLRYALNSIAAVAPNWLQQIVPENDWYSRYGQRFQENRFPDSKEERNTLAVQIGIDGLYLLDAIWSESAPELLRQIEAVEILRQVWLQQFYLESGLLKLREPSNCPPPARLINSPYASLSQQNLSPSQHIVDAGYIDTELLVTSQKNYKIDLIGPAPDDSHWQARAGKGFSLADFKIDWDKEIVRCPNGKLSRTWKPRFNRYQKPVIHVAFQKSDCQSCPTVSDCTKAKGGFRTLTLRPQEFHETLEKARVRKTTSEFKKQYATRAGIEATISQGTRAFGLRRCRYRGFAKTRLQYIVTACALNLVRIWEWWTDAYTFGTTPSRFASLAL